MATAVAHTVEHVPTAAVQHKAQRALVLVLPVIGLAALIVLPSAQTWGMATGFLPVYTVMLFVGVLAAGGVVLYQSLASRTLTGNESLAVVATATLVSGASMLLHESLIGPFGSYNTGRMLFVAYTGAAAIALTVGAVRSEVQEILGQLRPEAMVAFVAVVGLGVLSAARAENIQYAFMDVSLYMGLVGAVLVVAAGSLAQQEKVRTLILWGFVASVTLYMVTWGYSWLQHGLYGRMIVWPDINLGFSNIRLFNHLQTWTLPLLVLPLLLLPKKHLIAKTALFFLCCGWWMLLFTSGGRGTVFGLIIASLAVALLFRTRAVRWLRVQGAAAAIGGVLYGLLYYTTATRSLLHRSATSDSGRLDYWAFALEQIQAAPLLGVGPMHYAVYPNSMGGHPHNAVLQFAAEWGLLAATLLIGLVAWGLVVWICQSVAVARDEGGHRREIRVALTAGLIAALAHAMVSGIVVAPLSQLLLVLVVGWALGLYIKTVEEKSSQAVMEVEQYGGWSAKTLVASTVLCGLFLVVSTAVEVPTVIDRQQQFEETTEIRQHHPRFWQQGFINVNVQN